MHTVEPTAVVDPSVGAFDCSPSRLNEEPLPAFRPDTMSTVIAGLAAVVPV